MIYHKHGESYMDYDAEGTDLTDLRDTVKDTALALAPRKRDFDSIAVTGVSGLLIGPPVACYIDVPLVVVRKDDDDSHNRHVKVLNAANMGKRVLFLDDFVACGDTLDRVSQHVIDASNGSAKVVAKFLYRDQDYVALTAESFTPSWLDDSPVPF